MIPRALSLLLLLLGAAGPGALRNGDFALVEDGLPAAWKADTPGQGISVDRADHPEGCAQSLRVDVRAAGGNDGQIVQRLEGLKPSTVYVLQGWLRSTAPRVAYLQVKLHRAGKELKRLSPPERGEPAWKEVALHFSTDDSDAVEILCRYRQQATDVGQTAWFAGLRLAEAGPPTLRVAEVVPTFHSAGVYAPYDGSVLDRYACRVRYRREGDPAWKQGMALIPDRENREFRGSLLDLAPDTAYEVQCDLVESATAKVLASAPGTVRTWSETVPVGEVRRLPGGISKGPLVIRDQGKPDAWIVYRPADGQECVVDAEKKAEQAIRFEGAAYVLLENVAVRGGARHGISLAKSHHVRIRRCDVSGWGDPGTRKEGLPQGLWVDANGRPINGHVGVYVGEQCSQVVVEENYIHHPRGTANSWQFGHPMGPQGVMLARTGGNNVVRHNDIIGCEEHWWNDAIESISNSEINGGPYRDADLYGNVLAFCNDDGTELDGGQINVRYWHNWVDRALCGVSCAPNRMGPSYVFRNVFAELGEERRSAGSAFKMGGGARWTTGVTVVAHNTIYGRGGGLRSVGYGSEQDRGGYVALSRNNLFGGTGGTDVSNVSEDPRNDFDYDLLGRGGAQIATGGEKHAVTTPPTFAGAESGDLRLAAGSSGVDQGCPLPGLNDGFQGKAPDMGAFERGADPDALFPPRPGGVSALPLRLHLEHWPGTKPASGEVRLVVPTAAGARWTAHPSSPWLRCIPASGTASAQPQTVVLTAAEAGLQPRLHRGAVTFRTDLGLCRTVMLDLKAYPPDHFAVAFEAEAGKVEGGFVRVADPSASGGAYLHAPDGTNQGSVTFAFDVPRDGDYLVAARFFVPTPDAGLHDSFYFSVDGEARQEWGLTGSGVNTWIWGLLRGRDEPGPRRYHLAKGQHTLTILSRESLSRLDRVAITNSPYAEEPRVPR